MNTPTNWAPGLIVLLAALAVGIVVVLRSRRGAALPAPERTRREELERQKEAKYALLQEHNAARGDRGAEWAAERDRLELEAARVLRDLDALADGAVAPSAAAASSFGARNPRLVGALWGGGVVLFLGALALTLQEFAAPRPEGATMTGNAVGADDGAGGAAALSPAQEAHLATLRAAAEAAPSDVAARNAYGHALLHAGKLMDAYQQAEAVVALAPDDPESRTHQAIVLIAIGDAATSAKALDRVIEGAPTFGEALAYRGAIHFQAGERDQAIALLERAIAADPRLVESVGPLIDAARTGEGPMAGAGSPPAASAATGGAGPMAGGAGPMAGGAAPSGPSPDDITGTIALDPRVAGAVKPGDTLFLSARPEGVTGGPPTWVSRVPVTSFPLAFTLGPANAMLGGPTPPALVITARIDRDGNAKTKSPDDLEGKTAVLKPGATDVAITLAAVGP